MEIFNIGALELVFIVLLAFIVLGPKKAVEAAGDLGRWIRKVTRSPFWQDIVNTSKEIKDIPRAIMDDAEIKKTLDDIERSTHEVNETFKRTQQEVRSEMPEQGDDLTTEHRIYPGEESGKA